MDGKTLTRIVDSILQERGISRLELCKAIGITSAAYSNWKNGGQPRRDKIEAIEKWLEISFSDYEKSDPREELREDHRMLLKSIDGLPQSSVYELVAEVYKRREAGWGDPTN